MRRVLIAVCTLIVALVALGAILLRTKGPSMLNAFLPIPSPEEMYPPAPPMPPAVTTPVEDLLSQYETFLSTKVPAVFSALQPGLNDSQVDALEQQHSLRLPADLRALYRWRNGTPRSANVDAFPNHAFVPLDVALADRDGLRKAGTAGQQQAYAAFAGHRGAWVGLIVDMAGDGHFFDPGRSESQGSFFFCFAEDGSYVFYPAFRNYLAAIIDGQESGVFVAGARGVDTADFVKAQQLWGRYGAGPPR